MKKRFGWYVLRKPWHTSDHEAVAAALKLWPSLDTHEIAKRAAIHESVIVNALRRRRVPVNVTVRTVNGKGVSLPRLRFLEAAE